MGALMFSLLTMEMMYTSMDYLTPSNFRRGNSYPLTMYMSLPQRLKKLLKKLVTEYEEEHQRLIASRVQPAVNPSPHIDSTPNHNGSSGYANNDVGLVFGSSIKHGARTDIRNKHTSRDIFFAGDSDGPVMGAMASSFIEPRNIATRTGSRQGQMRPPSRAAHTRQSSAAHTSEQQAGFFETFDPNQYLVATEEAESVIKDLETIKKFIGFIEKFIEVRKAMVVLYRFVAVTGPVLYTKKLRLILSHCKSILQEIVPNPLYESLLDHVRHEVWLVHSLVDWDAHVVAHDFVRAVTSMKKSRLSLKTWQSSLPENLPSSGTTSQSRQSVYDGISDTFGGRRERENEGSSGHGILYAAFAKSTRLVQSLLWGDNSSNASDSSQSPAAGRMRGIVIWIQCWVEHLTFKTTTYFQQIIASQRALQHDDSVQAGRQQIVLNDIWTRPEMAKANLNDMIAKFMHANDGCFVALLFESTIEHPFALDGFAISGTKIRIPDYHVQACATLFCMANHRLLHARGRVVKESLIQDVHSVSSSSTYRDNADILRQTDSEWFRQNCLPDILYVLEGEKVTMDLELLGSSPLLEKLDIDADKLLVELSDSVYEVVKAAAEAAAASSMAAEPKKPCQSADIKSHFLKANSIRNTTRAIEPTERQSSSAMLASNSSNRHAETTAGHSHNSAPNIRGEHHLAGPKSLLNANSASPLTTNPHFRSPMQQTPPADMAQSEEENLSLYSTYLLKSHLRNNLTPHERQTRGGNLVESQFLGHNSHPVNGADTVGSRNEDLLASNRAEHNDSAAINAAISAMSSERAERDPMTIKLARAKRNSDVIRLPKEDPVSTTRSTTQRRPATAYFNDTDRVAGKGATATTESRTEAGSSAWGRDTNHNARRVSTSNIQSADARHTASGHDLSLFAGRRARAAVNSMSNVNIAAAERAPSVRSLFRPLQKPSAQASQALASGQKLPESEVARRVYRGERLKELFGSWQATCDDAEGEICQGGGASSAALDHEIQRSSITSLSYSTPTRASLGRRAGASALAMSSAAASVANAMSVPNTAAYTSNAMPLSASSSSTAQATATATAASQPAAANFENASSGGFTHRLSRVAAFSRPAVAKAQPASGIGSAHTSSELGSMRGSIENLLHVNSLQRPQSARGSRSKTQQQQQQQQHGGHLPQSHARHQPQAYSGSQAAADGGGSEGYTYLYARVGVPNIVLVAVILDTERGLSRRREAMRAWDEIVGAVRGMPLFEQLMSLSN
ncbi:hypothetical protein LPJ64_000690 [Coemansia asiatica]|uniref:Uncharacterized protein n=1 Tax=Coemansia asiatica TaxID=1052880 RepID=A0A9W7XR40_9FUNG|nr:hypothetical protein LPJ64_000690 [Coemansia asiatica]